MGFDLRIIPHDDYLEIVVTGSYDLDDAVNKFPHVLDVCRHKGLQKVLIDFTKVQGEGGSTEQSLYTFGIEDHYKKYLKSGGHELKIAYVGSMVASYEPGVKIAELGELPFKLFDQNNKALEWLSVKSKDQSQ